MSLRNISDLIGSNSKSIPGQKNGNAAEGVKITQETHLLQVVSQYVPTEVRSKLCFVRLLDGQLRITVDNAASATRIRFAGQAIKRALQQQEGLRVERVTLHVKPPEEFTHRQRRTESRPNPVSVQSASLIESTAASVEAANTGVGQSGAGQDNRKNEGEDVLARALYRLAKVLRDKSTPDD